MKTEEQLLVMYAQANPIELDELLEMVRDGQVKQLPTPRTGSGEPIDLDTSNRQPTEKRSATPWLVAAAAIVVFGVSLFLVTNEPTQTATSPTTVIENLDEWLLIPLLQQEEDYRTPEGRLGQARAGTNRTRSFTAAFSFTVATDWQAEELGSAVWIAPIPPGGDHAAHSEEPSDLIFFNPYPTDMYEYGSGDASVRAVEGLLEEVSVEGVEVTGPVDVELGGAPGKRIEISAVAGPVTIRPYPNDPDDPDEPDDPDYPDYPSLTIYPGRAMPIYVLNVGYEIVLIFVESPVGGSDFIDKAQSVLDSIFWKDLN